MWFRDVSPKVIDVVCDEDADDDDPEYNEDPTDAFKGTYFLFFVFVLHLIVSSFVLFMENSMVLNDVKTLVLAPWNHWTKLDKNL